MDILWEDEKEVKSIKLGDVFTSVGSFSRPQDNAFVLTEVSSRKIYAVVSLSGLEAWRTHETLKEMVELLCKDIDRGVIKHYSQDEWQMRLERK